MIVAIAAASYWLIGREAEVTIANELLRRERTVAKAEKSNLTVYFQTFGNAVASLAQYGSIARRDASTIHDMDIFVEQRRANGIVAGIVLTDSKGIVKFNSNISGTRDLGMSLADRDYFLWAKGESEPAEYFIGRPVVSRLGASKGLVIVPVAAPVYNGDTFTGAMIASVKLAPLTSRFLGLMKVSDTTEVYLVDEEGSLLFNSAEPAAADSSIFDFFQNNPFDGSQALSDKIEAALGAEEGGEFRTAGHLVAYSPVLLGSQSWLVIMASPSQAIMDLAEPIYIRQTAVILMLVLTFLLFGVIVARK